MKCLFTAVCSSETNYRFYTDFFPGAISVGANFSLTEHNIKKQKLDGESSTGLSQAHQKVLYFELVSHMTCWSLN